MPTSKTDRLNNLFQGGQLPLPPEPDQPHIADTELVSRTQSTQSLRTVPELAQGPKSRTRSTACEEQETDPVISSEEDDEYIRAFRKAPTVRTKKGGNAKKMALDLHQKPRQAALGSKQGSSTADEDTTERSADGNEAGRQLVRAFCPLALVTKFCYKYIDDPDQRVSRHFFAAGKIWNRHWDVYFLHPPTSMPAKPILLVPEQQVQRLLDEINTAFKIFVEMPRTPFLLAFYQDGTPNPVFLGSSRSRADVTKLEEAIPDPPADHGECPQDANMQMKASFERFKDKVEQATAAGKKKANAKKKAKTIDRLTAHANHIEALKRGQRYLGLRPPGCKGSRPLPDTSLPWHEQQRFEREQTIKYGTILPCLNVKEAAPCHFDRDVVFVAVDIEAYERNHNAVTEIGISTLDTADVKEMPPGPGGSNWMELIRSRHFRISDHAHLRNTTFCVGDPDSFRFGSSEFVSMTEIGGVIDSCFQSPYSHGFTRGGDVGKAGINDRIHDMGLKEQRIAKDIPSGQLSTDPVDTHGTTNETQDLANKIVASHLLPPSKIPVDTDTVLNDPEDHPSQNTNPTQISYPKSFGLDGVDGDRRNVILVGHDLDADLNYLSTLNSVIFSKPPVQTYPQPLEPENPLRRRILESLDTAKLYQAWKGADQITSLAKAVNGIDRTGWGLHNGGNDARYTMEVLLGMLVQSRLEQGERTGDLANGTDGASNTTS